ncbi:hypothetical protein K488DRAFT_68588 [Vararia minispora EC-137]|uniref:Uncharacterized protein n=1 Tax=Vararia minispora EC-137 TaxID=1314806 RepID=A0ACB8QU30_9AGAM|nr:hypothetical protein K488DRAFT_68588 [Vararia minispora EC-137]
MAAPAYRANPPPFGVDNPGDVFADPKPAGRHDAYPDEKRRSGVGAVGLHLMNADFDDDEDYDPAMNRASPMPALAAPRPGYAAPIAALNVRHASPSPSPPGTDPFNPPNQQQPRQPPAARTNRPPVAPINVPSTPHPLPPTMTPIKPVFARPQKEAPAVRFGTPILRSEREDTIARRGEKGDDFWRRFSMIAKEPSAHKESKWLHDTQTGKSRWSRYVWVIGLLLLACIGLAIGLGVYFRLTNKSTVQSSPKAIGGSEENSGTLVTSSAAVGGTSSSLHVSPTYTVARREPIPSPVAMPVPVAGAPLHVMHLHPFSHDARRSRRRGNRTMH